MSSNPPFLLTEDNIIHNFNEHHGMAEIPSLSFKGIDTMEDLKILIKQILENQQIVLKFKEYHEDGFDILNGSPRDIWASIWNILGQPPIPKWVIEQWEDLGDKDEI